MDNQFLEKPKVVTKAIQVIPAPKAQKQLKIVKVAKQVPSKDKKDKKEKVKFPQISEKTILAKNKSHYTVQLYGSNEAQKVANFKQMHGLDKAWVVQKRHQGKTWHVLVMGDYATKVLAEKATERLPNSLHHAKIKPWVRDFASLQNEIVNSNKKS